VLKIGQVASVFGCTQTEFEILPSRNWNKNRSAGSPVRRVRVLIHEDSLDRKDSLWWKGLLEQVRFEPLVKRWRCDGWRD